ncbi:DUF1801 domain-containing protein [Robiginitalea sp. SC105]|uniref:DUF1801 domain-containing protein n=1 Tax=Robiginitalea sp. SC105 TaxID=2762332 RepID=UPI00163AF99A|nr:DUF1801 domain-containing protein [Robiginitalea sp. SC105]MBC2839738.1 DUF1801 domain-containing protein [Robiginitalea sp. SC105]
MNPAETYILSAREPYRSILVQLQVLIEAEVPGAEMRFKYRIPFYYVEGRPFCYLNQSGDYVDLGFARAAHLTRHLDKMESKGRKFMRSLRYRREEDIDADILADVLREAYSVRLKPLRK